jgi:hypothetical protein
MPLAKRRRFLKFGDLEANRVEEERVIKEYGLHLIDDSLDIALDTIERREFYRCLNDKLVPQVRDDME